MYSLLDGDFNSEGKFAAGLRQHSHS
jgi:hypothetical protein